MLDRFHHSQRKVSSLDTVPLSPGDEPDKVPHAVERDPLVLREEFLAEMKAKAIALPRPCHREGADCCICRAPVLQFIERTADGWPRTVRVITLWIAAILGLALLVLATLHSVGLAGLAGLAAAIPASVTAVHRWTRKRGA